MEQVYASQGWNDYYKIHKYAVISPALEVVSVLPLETAMEESVVAAA
jgi:hypothetical protein